ncbi:hypothetical protein CNX70_02560 [Janthinobacterium svalbardensis]|uniref:Uncharacterized protein n=1 Tax=Janthinobacterium svalbardensis TaxID=368607 RepID=A0A290WQM8_9BURK|nr:hypothetical protein CNX70_02560 [Janthinobacterium svalbardensis]
MSRAVDEGNAEAVECAIALQHIAQFAEAGQIRGQQRVDGGNIGNGLPLHGVDVQAVHDRLLCPVMSGPGCRRGAGTPGEIPIVAAKLVRRLRQIKGAAHRISSNIAR